MDNRKFKQTEIGEIPVDWEVKELGKYASIVRGGSPRPIQDYITTNANGINWIKIGDVKPEEKYIVSTEEKIIPEGKVHSREVKAGDFILSNSMSFGRPYILKIDGCIHDGWLAIQSYQETFDIDFLYYLLGSDEIFTQYIAMAAGSSVQNLNKEKVSKLIIPLPPTLAEQQRIAKALSDVDNVIATLEKLIQKKKNIKQGAMQELLTGKKHLPGFAKSTAYKHTELGEIPEDWEVKSLGDCLKDMSDGPFGSNLKTEHYTSKREARIIQLSNVGEDAWNNDNVKYTTFSHANTISRCIVPYGAVVIAKMMPAGRSIICPDDEPMYILGSDCVKFIPNENLIPEYFVYYSKGAFYLNQINENTQGSTRARTSVSKLRKILLVCPSRNEQSAIAKVLSDMDKEIDSLNKKLQKYRQLKTAMMQQLLTGKIRLA